MSDADKTAKIDVTYTQDITVTLPVRDVPDTEREAWYLLKDTHPEFIRDALPTGWNQATSVGDIDVTNVSEVDDE